MARRRVSAGEAWQITMGLVGYSPEALAMVFGQRYRRLRPAALFSSAEPGRPANAEHFVSRFATMRRQSVALHLVGIFEEVKRRSSNERAGILTKQFDSAEVPFKRFPASVAGAERADRLCSDHLIAGLHIGDDC